MPKTSTNQVKKSKSTKPVVRRSVKVQEQDSNEIKIINTQAFKTHLNKHINKYGKEFINGIRKVLPNLTAEDHIKIIGMLKQTVYNELYPNPNQ